MKQRLKEIMDAFHAYNTQTMMPLVYGLDPDTVYDAIVIAPSFSPEKLGLEKEGKVTVLREGNYYAGYLVEIDGKKIGWLKTASCDANCIDSITLCAELQFKKLLFVGSAGALNPNFKLGDVCTPTYSIAGGITHTYLKESIRDYVPFEKILPDTAFQNEVLALAEQKEYPVRRASVFCTPSVSLEYIHLEEVRSFGTDLVEMETASFYLMADLLEVPALALLIVSDNSAAGKALIGRSEEDDRRYKEARSVTYKELLLLAVKGA